MNNPRSFVAALARAWKSLTRRPGVFITAVSSMAIALGLATAVIAQIDALMHPVMPFKDPETLYQVSANIYRSRTVPATVTPEEINTLVRQANLFETIIPRATEGVEADGGAFVGSSGISLTYPGYFQLLGVKPRMGRLFAPNETIDRRVVIVSDQFWRRYYSNATTLTDAKITVTSGTPDLVGTYDIVGVLPRGLDFVLEAPLLVPNRSGEFKGRNYFARIRPGVTDAGVDSAFTAIAAQLKLRHNAQHHVAYLYGSSFKPGPVELGAFHWAMIAATVFILVIACANVAALMLARSVVQRRDQALRLALGARWIDVMRELAAEITIIAGLGGLAGLAIGQAAMGVLIATTPTDMDFLGFLEPKWNPRVFIGLFGSVLSAIVVAGLLPAWYVTRIAPAEPLKDSSGTTTGRPNKRFQVLVVAELALSMILLFGASLVAKTVRLVEQYDFGYDARTLTRVEAPLRVFEKPTVYLPGDPRNPARRGFVEFGPTELVDVVRRLRALPQVVNAAWVASYGLDDGVMISDATYTTDSLLYKPVMFNVGANFLSTLGLPLVAGRDFQDGDRSATGAVILDEASAKRLFPQGDAVGRLVKLGRNKELSANWVPVIGIARNGVHELPDFPELANPPVVYVSQLTPRGISPDILVRTRGVSDEGRVAAVRTTRDALPIRTSVNGVDWVAGYNAILSSRRFIGGVIATLSLASLALATAGLFGVLSYVVSQRMREFAVRIALGATRRDVIRLVMRDALVMALGGTALGAFAGFWTGFAVYEWLWGVYPIDAGALVIAEAVLLTVTVGASLVPALRATRADPVQVMRAS